MSTQPRHESPFQNRTLIIAAVLLAIAAFLLNFFYVKRITERQERDAFDVLVAAADLRADTAVSERDIETVRVPGVFRDRLPGVVSGSEINAIKGDTVKRSVQRGQVLFWEHFGRDTADSPAKLIDPRYRGVTVRIDAESTPTALLRPGGYIDLVATVRLGTAAPETMTIMEYVRVVATGSQVQPGPEETDTSGRRAPRSTRAQSFRDITLALRPEDGEKLRAVQTRMEGRGFIVHVRNPNDTATRWGKGAFNPRLDEALGRTGETEGAGP